MDLFQKLIDPNKTFNLSLLNVGFTKFNRKTPEKGGIKSFFSKQNIVDSSSQETQAGPNTQKKTTCRDEINCYNSTNTNTDTKTGNLIKANQGCQVFNGNQRERNPNKTSSFFKRKSLSNSFTSRESCDHRSSQNLLKRQKVDHHSCNVDRDLVKLDYGYSNGSTNRSNNDGCPQVQGVESSFVTSDITIDFKKSDQRRNIDIRSESLQNTDMCKDNSDYLRQDATMTTDVTNVIPVTKETPMDSPVAIVTSDITLPPDVDATVFSELPPEVRVELLEQWKNQRNATQNQKTRTDIKNIKTKSTVKNKTGRASNIMNYFRKT